MTAWVLRHRRLVVVLWALATLAGVAATSSLGGALSKQFTVPGREGYETNRAILARYGSGGRIAPLVAVASLPPGATARAPAVRAQLDRAFARIGAAVPHARVLASSPDGDRPLTSADGRTAFALVFPAPDPGEPNGNSGALAAARRAAGSVRVAGAPVRITGVDVLSGDGSGSGGPGVALESLIGAGGALLVLALSFGSLLALVPVLMALPAIMVAFLLVRGLAGLFDVSYIVQYLVALIGLGVAIDYALLVATRWREERDAGAENEAAVARAMATAGRAVLLSGTTVAIGLLALVVLPVPFLRSLGVAGLLIPLVSVAVALTLLPVLLATIGPRLDGRRRRGVRRAGSRWGAFAALVVRRRVPAALAGLAMLGALLAAATTMRVGEPQADALAKGGAAHAALVALERSGIGAGALTPIEVLMPEADAGPVARRVAAVPGIRAAVAPAGPAWRRGGDALVEALPDADGATPAGRRLLRRVRAAAHAASAGARVGGPVAGQADFIDAIYGSFLPMLAAIALLTFLLLARAFRSLVLPLKAVLLNVLSVGAAWGVMTLVWQHGHGSHAIWGLPATGSVTFWVPIFVFAFLFGLSMDYEVFILARVREEHDATGSTDAAVVRGLARTGRLVTSAALILFLAFVAMGSGPETDMKIMATGLAAGILLDATVVRALLLPATVSLLGRWNWWMPRPAARLLRVAPSEELARAAAE